MQVWFVAKGPPILSVLCIRLRLLVVHAVCQLLFFMTSSQMVLLRPRAWEIDVLPPSVLVWQVHHQAVSPDSEPSHPSVFYNLAPWDGFGDVMDFFVRHLHWPCHV